MFKFSNFLPPYTWTELYVQEFEVQIAVDAMQMLIKNQENSWEEIKDQFKKKIEEDPILNSLEEEDRSSYYDQVYSMEVETIREIKRLQRNSVFLSIFAFFEGRLKAICENIKNENNISTKLSDIRKQGDIQKFWHFLTTIYNINGSNVEPYLVPIEQHKFARNMIAHSEGYISTLQKGRVVLGTGLNIRSYTADIHQIEINNESFLSNLLIDISDFYKELFLAIDEKYKADKGITS